MSTNNFSQLSLSKPIVENLASLGYEQMTPIQALSVPLILDGKDLIAKAKTGSGKTAAFGLGIVQQLRVKQWYVQSLVLCPTRELADQVSKSIRQLARTTHNVKVLTLCGGMPIGPQIGSLKHGAHIIVGTPGRINDLLRKGHLAIDRATQLVLDEADRMLDMGFQDDLDKIVSYMPAKRQTLLFSATYPDSIKALAQRVCLKPQFVEAQDVLSPSTIKEQFVELAHSSERDEAVLKLLHLYRPEQAIVFCNTKRETTQVANYLKQAGWVSLALHGDLEQAARDVTLVRFANGSATVMVATDVAARGIDVADLELVINYQLSREAEVHTHRIGRTGRAGKDGVAISLFTEREYPKLALRVGDEAIENHRLELPDDSVLATDPKRPSMHTLQIDGGKKVKLRPGDILGALTAQGGVQGSDVGKIDRFDFSTFVAIKRDAVKVAMNKLQSDKIKGRQYRSRVVRG